jgi:MFS transporter, DHA2 family, methylenomycin A resistance protein
MSRPVRAGMTANVQPVNGATGREGLALIALCTGYVAVLLDTTVVTVALPPIARSLGSDISGMQWVQDAYSLTFAGLLMSAGSWADRLGGRRIMLYGLALFTVASVACGLATSVPMLIAARAVQGVGAALLVPSSLSLLQTVYTDPGLRARAVGIWGGVGGIAAGAGPVVGGLLVSALNWRFVFLVNLPVAAVGALLIRRYVPESPRRAGQVNDAGGQLLAVVGLAALTTALIEVGARGWGSALVLGSFAAAAIAVPVFAWVERRAPAPLLPIRLFDGRAFSSAAVIGVLLNFGFYGQLFVLTVYFQEQRGYSPWQTGFALLPPLVLTFIACTWSGRITARRGPRAVIMSGLSLATLGLLGWLLCGTATPYLGLILPMAATGFGCSLTMPAATTAIMRSAPAERGGIASGVLNSARQTGSLLGVAILGTIIAGQHVSVLSLRVAMLTAAAALTTGALVAARGLRSPDSARATAGQADRTVVPALPE